jgi:hypothetical protein
MENLPLIIANVIPHHMQRYDTEGDWYQLSGVQHFCVSRSNAEEEFKILVHEMVEWFECQRDGISQEEVDKWDMDHPDLDDPGSHPDCPYYKQHMKALDIERQI